MIRKSKNQMLLNLLIKKILKKRNTIEREKLNNSFFGGGRYSH